jgi:hypothetical protein
MDERPSIELERLRSTLATMASDYVLLSPLPDTKARTRFIGRFEGRDVIWDMMLYTLARHEQERGKVPTASNFSLRGLMIVAPESEETYRLEVALNLPLIDEPAVKKTIVMMRNYRQLRLGLRTWGDEDPLPSDTP